TVPHQLVADHARQWYGAVLDDRLWRHKCTIGGRGSSWLALMDYVVRAIAESPDAMSGERLGARVQELITAQLLDEWATQAG
ncbi:AraC family transcriptional regulator, partial [Rhodococcus erythropolis]|nr:AraC family transcriptional regulator [Rhodococcus erythropolis]